MVPRLRMFAGPNGSGKSTLKFYLPETLLGIYLNPDEIEENIRQQGFLDFGAYGLNPTKNEVLNGFIHSTFLHEAGCGEQVSKLQFHGSRLIFDGVQINSYLASVAVDIIRQKLIAKRVSFTFETVMSHRSKVNILAQARAAGYRTYLYFVATDDPEINISRVRSRAHLGGHDVPPEKIIPRYYRSLDLLIEAIRHSNRAYVFDNSSYSPDGKQTWLAEITDGIQMVLKTDKIPAWFIKSVLNKVG